MKRNGVFFFCVFIAWFLPVLSHAATLIDQTGRTVEVPDDPKRIISLMPSLTEMAFELGQGERIIAVTQYSNDPPAVLKLPKVGSYVHLDIERIVALKPDLCLSYWDGNPQFIVDKLEALGIPVYTFDPRSLEGIMDSFTRLGGIVHAEAQAAEQVATMQEQLQEVEARVARFGKRPRVFFQIDASPLVSAGTNTFMHKLITRAGGINLAAGNTPYPRYSWEDVLLMQPEVVIVTSMAGGYSEEQLKAAWLKWPQIPAVRNKRIYVVVADQFDRPTTSLFNSLGKLVEILHPQEGFIER
ncbi:MAG: cobalamin-binding protein [Proteobacteria bacterium]|nr:cobalamin-binding protein [Pseudomonadota bacterium]MBU4294705.1 cobalamin-binding protein [Pseudomonadota bacterium]MCG2749790.1 cobalamin-binding protein [Desulfobulbaceae bacterium]